MNVGLVTDARQGMAWLTLRFPGHGMSAMVELRDYDSATDADLIAWSAGGDRRAFDNIVVRHGRFALRVAMRLIPHPPTAEDVVQEALVRAWAQAGQFDPRRARFTTWLYRIVINLCIDQRRRVQPDSLPEGFDAPDPAAGADDGIEARERQASLARALRELPERQRAAMTLVYDEGLSGAEAGRVLGLSAKAVERLLARGRAFLRSRLMPMEGDLR
jgi:RNA polymerase sigma-70 factor (ECF subfamily)